MIYELRIYDFRPGQIQHYFSVAGTIGKGIRGPEHGTLVGFWTSLRGTLDAAVHIWAYASLDHRQQARSSLEADPRWSGEFLPLVLPLFAAQEVRFLQPASEPMSPDIRRGAYCLETYESPPASIGSLIRSVQAQQDRTSIQLFTGISPWPNSAVVLRRSDSPLRGESIPGDAHVRERLLLEPTAISPLS